MSYQVGLDLGSTFTTVSTWRQEQAARLEVLAPSVVFQSPDGTFLVGEDAERRALTDPGRVARQFKNRIGDPTPLRIGDTALTAEVVTARFLLRLLSSLPDGKPARVAMTYPAGWGHYRLESLRAALSAAGLADVSFVPEPVAAVRAHDALARLDDGAAVAVYDLGGKTFDAAVVRKLAADRFVLAGPPEELEVGGLDFDEVVFQHVVAALQPGWDALDPMDPAVLTAVAELRRACTAAKEKLSADTEVLIPVALPGISTREVRLGRTELESMIRPAVEETVATLDRALRAAGTPPHELAAVLLIGGSSRIPLVTQEVSAQLGRAVSPAPNGMAAIGAALEARGREPEPAAVATATWTRPPLPEAPKSVKPKRMKLTPLVAAGALAVAVAGGLLANNVLTNKAGAKTTTTITTTVTTTTEQSEETTVEYVPNQQTAPAPPPRTTTQPPKPKPTTTTTRPSTTTTTPKSTPPPSSTTTTTSGTTKAGAP
ncbi:Hsp70 family protein [Lentzea terrae]|uniref:Hsp70 family protein n=1 Tax=Lentzea terrae TaxID=2200761 RepID=UPI0013001723|nr:Hsp70 family protein [Lentzea terrae]